MVEGFVAGGCVDKGIEKHEEVLRGKSCIYTKVVLPWTPKPSHSVASSASQPRTVKTYRPHEMSSNETT